MADAINISMVYFSHQDFLLLGFPGFHKSRHLLFIPFFIVYLVILVTNGLIIHTVRAESSLHAPMYVLISSLSAVNICSTTTIVPKMLLGFLFHQNHISLDGCLIQMFFIYCTSLLDCNILLMMALDRYIAICRPLRYSSIMTKHNMFLLAFASLIRSVFTVCPIIYLASRVRYCRSNIIRHFACEHMALLGLACSNITKNKLVALSLRVFSHIFDMSFLSISYGSILRVALTISSGAARHKSLHTCGTHILVILIVYFFRMSSSIVYRVSRSVSQDTHNLLTAMYLFIPALVNPIIYGLMTKEIRIRILNVSGQVHVRFHTTG
ncbi:olfactory receptor 52K1-like [Hyla sarda]|uniref:olfactory receptor 52K1-like n=1 Tax=Hyla sarda TaxID=327740 RepID=UPI0024C2556B|nr:olfactory receptor 52K1-like [Hyla sarda]